MPVSNSDFHVKRGLVVGTTANVAGDISGGGNLNIINSITTSNTQTTHTVLGNTVINPATAAASATNPASAGADLFVNRVDGKISVGTPELVANNAAGAGRTTYRELFDDKFKVHGSSNTTVDARVGRNLSVGGNTAITGELNVSGNTFIDNTVTISRQLTLRAGLAANGDITLPAGAKVDGVDISELSLTVNQSPLLRVYDVNGTQVFP